MLKKPFFIVVAAFFVFFALALRADNIVDEIIARVNDLIITRADLERGKQETLDETKQRFPADWQVKWNQTEPDVLRDLIDTKLLLDKGKELDITGETELVKRLDELRKKLGFASIDDLEKLAKEQGVSFEDFKDETRNGLIREQVIGREVGSKINPTNEEVQAFYTAHQKEMDAPEEVQLSEILISTQTPNPEKDKSGNPSASVPADPARVAAAEAKANQVLDELRKGAKFEDVAKKSSDGPTAAQGGDLGTFKHGELAKEYEDKTFLLKAGEFTGVLPSKQGFLILKVIAHRPAGIPPLKAVENNIRQTIYLQKLEPAARAYLTKLREEAYIEIKSGFTDTGASPNQAKPIMVAANDPATEIAKHKKKKHFLLF